MKVGEDVNVCITSGMNPIRVTILQIGDGTNEQPWIVTDLDGSHVQFKDYLYMVQPSEAAEKKADEARAKAEAEQAARDAQVLADNARHLADNNMKPVKN
jgi:hypothetical protein